MLSDVFSPVKFYSTNARIYPNNCVISIANLTCKQHIHHRRIESLLLEPHPRIIINFLILSNLHLHYRRRSYLNSSPLTLFSRLAAGVFFGAWAAVLFLWRGRK